MILQTQIDHGEGRGDPGRQVQTVAHAVGGVHGEVAPLHGARQAVTETLIVVDDHQAARRGSC
jgi:hypothetical protein